MIFKRSKPTFCFEIDVQSVECDRFCPRWANYGLIVTQGNTLDELLDNASVDIMDQDGGELDVVPADAQWMVDEITHAYHEALKDISNDREHDRVMMIYPDEQSQPPIDKRLK